MRKSQVEIKSKSLDVDKTTVERILLAALTKFNLFDNTKTSRVSDTIKSVVEGKGYGFGLGARVVGNSIFIDFNYPTNAAYKFDEVREFILNELQKVFQNEPQEIWEDRPVYCKTN